jgi:hypothetical protein
MTISIVFQLMYAKVFEKPFPDNAKWNGKSLVEKQPVRPSQHRPSTMAESPRRQNHGLSKHSRLKKRIFQLGEKTRDIPDEEVLHIL